MNIDLIGTIIFAALAILVFKNNFNVKLAIILATILPLVATKIALWLPYFINEMPVAIVLMPTPSEIGILLLQLLVNTLVFIMIKRNDESLYKFALWLTIGLFVNYVLLPFVIR